MELSKSFVTNHLLDKVHFFWGQTVRIQCALSRRQHVVVLALEQKVELWLRDRVRLSLYLRLCAC